MAEEVRESPSGKVIEVEVDVLSVFGRVGDVIAEPGDYDALAITNESLVPGDTVEDALDYLLAHQPTVVVGSVFESFRGGNESVSVTNTNANIGDFGWNVIAAGAGGLIAKITAPAGESLGCYRMTSPNGGGNFNSLYLGAATTGIFAFDDWDTLRWRARFDTTVGNFVTQIGCTTAAGNSLGSGNSAAFIANLGAGGSSPFVQTRTSQASAGNFPQLTGVLVDNAFHDFEIRRVDADTIEFYIDGVLQTTHSTANGDGMPTGVLMPCAQAFSNLGQCFVDLSEFEFTPLT